MSWWNKKQNTEAIHSITPTFGTKLKDAYIEKVKKRKGKKSK